ncbi:MAG: AmmeMemoRadiSam system radical SAM enzyme [Candidatus Micrarchaeota archaeon]
MTAKMLAKKTGKTIKCLACSRYCNIAPNAAGFCGVRTNEKGKLKLSVYGKPCAVWADPIEKKPLFHFLPGTKSFSIGTFGCNFACDFCQNFGMSQAPQEARVHDPKNWKVYFQNMLNRCEDWSPERVVDAAVQSGSKSISFTYNEPTIFTEYAIDIMKLARKKGLKGIYVTNGYESKECWNAIKKYIDAVNIDLKAYNKNFYQKLCKVPDLEPIKESIKYAKKLGIWVEITTLLIPNLNDNENELKEMVKFLVDIDPEMPWHITAFHPDYKLVDKKPTPPASLVRAREIGRLTGLHHVYCGNVGIAYASYESTLCKRCRKDLITRIGFTVRNNNIIDGKCRFCKENVAGIWK